MKISGSTISFGPLGATRMACAEPIMNQEGKYLEALQHAERFRIEGTTLLVFSKGHQQPLRFVRTGPPARTSSSADSAVALEAHAWLAAGTEPFWALEIDSTGLRFKTPDEMAGVRWPPLRPEHSGDTLRWIAEAGRAAVAATIWPGNCSDGMSDRVWPYTAEVRVDTTTYRGCAESR